MPYKYIVILTPWKIPNSWVFKIPEDFCWLMDVFIAFPCRCPTCIRKLLEIPDIPWWYKSLRKNKYGPGPPACNLPDCWLSSQPIYTYIYCIIFWHSIRAFYLAFYLTFYSAILSDILFWHSIWHLFWHPIWHHLWHLYWHFLWHFFCHMFWHTFRHAIWHSIWHSILAFYLTSILTFSSGILSGILSEILCGWGPGTLWTGARGWGPAGNTEPELAVRVRRGTLWSRACGRGPAGNTLILRGPAGNTAI